MKVAYAKNNGFTIVELLIAIVVIGILATITVVVYVGVADRADKVALSSVQNQVDKSAKIGHIKGGVYPETVEGCAMVPVNPYTEVCSSNSGRLKWTYYDNTYNDSNLIGLQYTKRITPGYGLLITSGKHFAYTQTEEFIHNAGWRVNFVEMKGLIRNSNLKPVAVKFDAKSEYASSVATMRLVANGNSLVDGAYIVNSDNAIDINFTDSYRTYEIEFTPIATEYTTHGARLVFNKGGIYLKNISIYSK